MLLKTAPVDVHLARYSRADLIRLKAQIHRVHGGRHPASTLRVVQEEVLDWRYPIRTVDTRVVGEMKGSAFVKIRNKYRRASVCGVVGHRITDVDRLPEALRVALGRWESARVRRHDELVLASGYYDELFSLMRTDPSCVSGLLFLAGTEPVGLSIWDEPIRNGSNLIANVCDTTIPGLSDFQVVTSCRQLIASGVGRLNLGGSEIAGLDAFKEKYCPIESLKGLSVIVSALALQVTEDVDCQTIIEPVDNVESANFGMSQFVGIHVNRPTSESMRI
jgi:hypothetical protein